MTKHSHNVLIACYGPVNRSDRFTKRLVREEARRLSYSHAVDQPNSAVEFREMSLTAHELMALGTSPRRYL
jgi:hypothetical protein